MLPIAAMTIAAALPTPAAERSVGAAVAVVERYYAAINARDYRGAHAIWNGGHSLAVFRRGYADTVHAAVSVIPPLTSEGGAGSLYTVVHVRVEATRTNGSHQHFRGTYNLRRVDDVDGSTPAQRRWHIFAARLRAVPAGG